MAIARHLGAARGRGGASPQRIAYFAAAALVAWLVVPFALLLGAGVEGGMVLTVCTLFILFTAGMTWLSLKPAPSRVAGSERERQAGISGDEGSRGLTTQSGRLSPRAAAVQILIVPGAVALGFTAFALIWLFL